MKSFISIIFSCLILTFTNTVTMAEEKAYHIAPGDVLEISVWKDTNLSRQLVVPPDGIIAFPLIASIKVTNLTVDDLRKIVTKKLAEFVPEATVTIMLVEINSLKAFVIGKVNRPGEFEINMETNVMQILAKAGGLNPFASRGSIKILRQDDNKTIKLPFNYGQVEKGVKLEQNIILRAGDVVVVP